MIFWCDRVMVFSFYALIFFLPIANGLVESFAGAVLFFFFVKRGALIYESLKQARRTYKKISWLNVLTCIKESIRLPESYLNTPIGCYILVGFLSIFISQYPILSLKGFFFKLLQGTFLFFNFIECINTKKRLKILMTIFFISASIAAVNGVWQFYRGRDFVWGNHFPDGRVSASFRHPNDFGGYLVIVCPIIFSYVYRKVKGRKMNSPALVPPFVLLLFVFAVMGLGFTFSRGAWISFIIGMLYIGLQRLRMMCASLSVIILFLLIFSPQMQSHRYVSLVCDDLVQAKALEQKNSLGENVSPKGFWAQHATLEHIQYGNNQRNQGQQGIEGRISTSVSAFLQNFIPRGQWFTGSGRSGYWREAISMIRAYPLGGVGLNTYSKVAPNYKVNWGGYPHNCYLQMAAEIGLIGLLTFLWIMFRLIRNSLKNIRRIHDSYLSVILLGALGGMVGFLFHIAVDTHLYSVQLGNLMWILMGIIVASQKIAFQKVSSGFLSPKQEGKEDLK